MEKQIATNRWFRPVTLSLVTMLLLGGGYAAWHHFDAPPLERYAPLLAQLASGATRGDSEGRVDLSKTFPGLTPQDHAYILWRDDGTFLAMFPTYYGEGSQMAGLIYSSRPLRDEDTRPRELATSITQRVIAVGSYNNLVVEKRINPNWFHVSYKLH